MGTTTESSLTSPRFPSNSIALKSCLFGLESPVTSGDYSHCSHSCVPCQLQKCQDLLSVLSSIQLAHSVLTLAKDANLEIFSAIDKAQAAPAELLGQTALADGDVAWVTLDRDLMLAIVAALDASASRSGSF
jgi:hypothetical protein